MSREKHPNSRWLAGKVRVSNDRMVDDGRWIKSANGGWRFDTDSVTERAWVDRRIEQPGWLHGAKVYPV